MSFSVTIHMVSSLDGFIAKPDGTVSWLQSADNYEKGKVLSEEEIEKFLNGIDCYVMGSHTYEHALELGWPYGDVPVVVLTQRDLNSEKETVQFYAGELENLVKEHLKPLYEHVWMVGGAKLCKAFLQKGLADKLILSIMPILLGEGTLFFDYIGMEQKLHLTDVTAYKDGMVELSYELLKNS